MGNQISPSIMIIFLLTVLLFACCGDRASDSHNLPPEVPSNPSPADGASNQELDIQLSWQCSDPDGDDLMFDLYFGTEIDLRLLDSNITENSYCIDSLDYDTRYYWRIFAKDIHGVIAQGAGWSFNTRRAPGVYKIGEIDLDGERMFGCRIFVSGEYLYYADSWNGGLHIILISDPANPEYAHIYDRDTQVNDIFVSGEYAYLAREDSSFQILDILNPASPTLLSEIIFSYDAVAVAHRDGYAYVTSDGFAIIDVSDPANPEIVGQTTEYFLWMPLKFCGNYVCALHSGWETSYLDIVDISDASAPRLVGSCFAGGSAWSLAVHGDYVHMADWWFGSIRVFDISDPYNPTFIMDYGDDSMSDIYIHGNLAYCASSYRGLRIFDLSDDLNPEPVAAFDTENSVVGVFYANGLIYLVERVPRLIILEHVP